MSLRLLSHTTVGKHVLGSETVLLFGDDVKEARSEFLLALETAYRG
jgi:hypothetical protein